MTDNRESGPRTDPAIAYERLERSIGRHGVLAPILVDNARKIIDGRNRMRAGRELDREVPSITWPASTMVQQRQQICAAFRVMGEVIMAQDEEIDRLMGTGAFARRVASVAGWLLVTVVTLLIVTGLGAVVLMLVRLCWNQWGW